MSNFLIQLALAQIVRWISGLTKDDFARIVDRVVRAEKEFQESGQKLKVVKAYMATVFPQLTGWVANCLLELAVAKVKKAAPSAAPAPAA